MSLEDIREKKNSIWLYIIIGLLLVGMAGFGTSQFGTGSSSSSPTVLKGANIEITQAEFERTLSDNRRRFQDMDAAAIEAATVTQLQQRLALSEYLQQYPLAASNASIDQQIRNDHNFFDNGKFSETVFRRIIPVEPQAYRNSLSKDMALQDLQRAIATTGVISNTELTPYTEFQNLSRNILVAKLARSAFLNTANEAEIQSYYDSNKDQYMTDELFDIDYVDFNPETLISAVEVTDAEIIAAAAPPRSANYYLFSNETDANTAFAQISGGKTIAEVQTALADKIDDSGELGTLNSIADANSLIPQQAIDAIFALDKVGQVTRPMTVDGDIYVFELTDKSDSALSDSAKKTAKRDLQSKKAAPEIAALSEKLNKAVFETQTPDLANIAEIMGLSVNQSGLQAAGKAGDTVLALPEVAQAIQNSDKATGKLQEPVVIGERVIIYRINSVAPPEQKPLADIKTQVEQAAVAEKTDKQIAEAAKALIAATKTEGLTAAAEAKNYPTQSFTDFNGQVDENPVLDAIGALLIQQQTPVYGDKNAQELQSVTGDTYVYVNTDIRLGKPDDSNTDTDKQMQASLATSIGQLELNDFIQSITERTDIQVHRSLQSKQ